MRIGLFIGPFLAAGVIHFVGLGGAYGVGIVALVASALLAARIPDLPDHAAARAAASGRRRTGRASARSRRSHLRIFLTVGLGILLVSAVRASRQVVIPLWADHIGLEASVTSLVYGLSGAIDVMVFYPAGKVMDRKGRAWVAVPSMAIMGTALLLTPFTHGTSGPAGDGAADRLRQRHRLGDDHDARRGLLADARASALPGHLAADRRHRILVRAGAAVRRDRDAVARRRHLGDRSLGLAAAAALWYWIPRTVAPGCGATAP